MQFNQNEEFYDTWKKLAGNWEKARNSRLSMKLSNRRDHTKNSMYELEKKTKEMENDTKTKTLIEFNHNLSCSIKCLAEKNIANVKPTSRFFNIKMLIIAKISLMSYVYDVLKAVCFSNKLTREIYQKYSVDKILPYHVLRGIDSTCLFSFLRLQARMWSAWQKVQKLPFWDINKEWGLQQVQYFCWVLGEIYCLR